MRIKRTVKAQAASTAHTSPLPSRSQKLVRRLAARSPSLEHHRLLASVSAIASAVLST